MYDPLGAPGTVKVRPRANLKGYYNMRSFHRFWSPSALLVLLVMLSVSSVVYIVIDQGIIHGGFEAVAQQAHDEYIQFQGLPLTDRAAILLGALLIWAVYRVGNELHQIAEALKKGN
jgi:uncharacterized BrkB/YihY/UPF0761 family membrane protein